MKIKVTYTTKVDSAGHCKLSQAMQSRLDAGFDMLQALHGKISPNLKVFGQYQNDLEKGWTDSYWHYKPLHSSNSYAQGLDIGEKAFETLFSCYGSTLSDYFDVTAEVVE